MFANVRFERHHRLCSLYQVLKTFLHISSTLCLWSSITACCSANLSSSFIWSTMAHAVVRFELCSQSIQLLHHLGHSHLFLFRRVMLPRTIARRLCTFIVPDLDIIPTRTQSRHRARYSILSGSNNQCSRPDWFSFILPVSCYSHRFLLMRFAAIEFQPRINWSIRPSAVNIIYQMLFAAIKWFQRNEFSNNWSKHLKASIHTCIRTIHETYIAH